MIEIGDNLGLTITAALICAAVILNSYFKYKK